MDNAQLLALERELARPEIRIPARVPGPRSGLIVTRTPLRVSLAGGGTDLAAYCRDRSGAVLSTTIDKFVYVTLKRHDALFGAPIRLNYSETEQVSTVDEIRNEIARACFRFLEIGPPVYMSTVADIPAASGLGSSSSFAVGLLNALHTYRGEPASAGQLADEAAHIEIDVLGRPIGRQDHYAAAFGGCNLFRFLPEGGVSVEPQRFTGSGLALLFAHLLMFWTGIVRNAGDVLAEQQRNTAERLSALELMREQAFRLHHALGDGFTAEEVGRLLGEGWRLKRELASTITTPRIDRWYEAAIEAGAWGGKLCGAGGGGFLLFLVPLERRHQVRLALCDLKELPIRYEPQGSRVLMPHVE